MRNWKSLLCFWTICFNWCSSWRFKAKEAASCTHSWSVTRPYAVENPNRVWTEMGKFLFLLSQKNFCSTHTLGLLVVSVLCDSCDRGSGRNISSFSVLEHECFNLSCQDGNRDRKLLLNFFLLFFVVFPMIDTTSLVNRLRHSIIDKSLSFTSQFIPQMEDYVSAIFLRDFINFPSIVLPFNYQWCMKAKAILLRFLISSEWCFRFPFAIAIPNLYLKLDKLNCLIPYWQYNQIEIDTSRNTLSYTSWKRNTRAQGLVIDFFFG